MMLLDLHAHTKEISTCCRIPAAEVLKRAKEAGLDGIVLTNHYQKSYAPDGDYAAFAQRYIAAYKQAKALGDAMGLRVFFGIEVTMASNTYIHLLVYGVAPAFLEENPTLFDETPRFLYEKVHAAGGVLVQAHPFRFGEYLQDTLYLDGVEISCHPLYPTGTQRERLTEIAQKDGLLLTCGGDYHADTYRPHCGVYLPDEIADGVALGTYLKEAKEIHLLVQEVDGSPAYEVSFPRTARPKE